MLLLAHLHFSQTHKPTHQDRYEMTANKHDRKEGRSTNTGLAKVTVYWLQKEQRKKNSICFLKKR